MKRLSFLANRAVLFFLIFFNLYFWFGLIGIYNLIFYGGVMHGESVGFNFINILSDMASLFGVLGIAGLFFKIKRLYFGFLVFGIIGLAQNLFNLADEWFSYFLGLRGTNPQAMTVLFIFPLILNGGLIVGYKLINQKQ